MLQSARISLLLELVFFKGASSEASQTCWDLKNLVSPSPRLRRHTSLTVKPNTQVEIKEGKEDEKEHSCRFLTALPDDGRLQQQRE